MHRARAPAWGSAAWLPGCGHTNGTAPSWAWLRPQQAAWAELNLVTRLELEFLNWTCKRVQTSFGH